MNCMHKLGFWTTVLLAISLLTSGCATMIHGSKQKIHVKTQPSGALVKVSGQTMTTPGSVVLARKGVHTLLISKEGYNTERINLRNEESPLAWLDVALMIPGILPGVIALAVDFKAGALFDLSPSEVGAVLQRKATSQTANDINILQRPDIRSDELLKRSRKLPASANGAKGRAIRLKPVLGREVLV